MRTVILGIGNTILSDEGVGVHAAERLRAAYELPEGVEVIDGGTAGMELLDPLSDVDLLLVLDAVKARRAPGTVILLTGDEVPVFFRAKLSPHQVSICDVLASLEFAGNPPRDLVLIGCEPLSLELGTELTPTVAEKVPEMISHAVAQLALRGIRLELRQAVAEAAPPPGRPKAGQDNDLRAERAEVTPSLGEGVGG
ncbi:MAG: HyaD/HybD family hydrogenase maturation endopeptidase [Rhodocyclaceae bacterium]|nr:Hydrogenase 2 maturation protease [Rhodocyclaceae bacterium]MBZ0142206.1 HyaD/HybD family hydrogenase maturation endopeptidase [Rhodocyclaceae bacterium]MCC6880307.1 HyaD/HybD family hydrogenase maturation endopeptidase [Rhodocyclaceae bacterium]MCL4683010.1 HyaD/HybD family hydrogenase maturation endopeptidase [Rhodocyclaceae bacterium]